MSRSELIREALRRINAKYPFELRVATTLNIPKPHQIEVPYFFGSYVDREGDGLRVYRFENESDKQDFEDRIIKDNL